ncbi:MAG: T9SS type A sorting domain-containing protein [Bacteroidetes bacterium]|nr:T9SS type A sorting domain-containing protein [Bacteroidota bacterium]
MKNRSLKLCIRIIISFFLLSLISENCRSQIYQWNPLQKLTSGYTDRNPGFGTKQENYASLFTWEFLVFERHSDTVSNICVLKMGTDGPVDSVIYLTNGNVINLNPSISYNSDFFSTVINNSLVLWETNRNGRWDIYASYYETATGWQTPFAVDTSESDKHSARSVYINSTNFGVVYERDNNIIFKILDAANHTVSYDTNLTSVGNSVCGNPFITYSPNPRFYVSYEKEKPDGKREIEVRKSTLQPNWTAPDTVAYAGDNINNGMVGYFGSPVNIFISDRLGNYNIYGTAIDVFEAQKPVVIDTAFQNFDFESYLFPIITDGGFFNYANAYIRKSDSIKIIFSDYINQNDMEAVSDSSYNISLTMNRGMQIGNFDALVWVVFNKDSSGFTNLYGKSIRIIILDINKVSSEIPVTFKLYQNYPNPFNPVTKIKFDIPGSARNSGQNVKLIIFDALGREVEKLFDSQLNPGTYEVTWNAGKYSSGIYFYTLVSEKFSVTKKLILVK